MSVVRERALRRRPLHVGHMAGAGLVGLLHPRHVAMSGHVRRWKVCFTAAATAALLLLRLGSEARWFLKKPHLLPRARLHPTEGGVRTLVTATSF